MAPTTSTDPLIDTLAEPLVMLRNMLGQPGDQTTAPTQLRTASTAIDDVHTSGRTALSALNATWTGTAADSATGKITAAQTAAAQIADRGNAIAGIVDQANADMNTARSTLDSIVASFRAAAAKLGSSLHTPPGMSAILDVGRDHLQQAKTAISAAEASCTAHASALAGLTPPTGQVPAAVNLNPAAPPPAEQQRPTTAPRDDTSFRDARDDTVDSNGDQPRFDPYTGERINHHSSDNDALRQALTDVVQVGASAVGAGLGEVQHLIDQAQNGQLFGGNGNGNDPFGGLHPNQPAAATPGVVVPGPAPAAAPAAKPAPVAKPAAPPKPPAATAPVPEAPAAPPATPDADHHDAPPATPPAPTPPGPSGQAGVTAALPPAPRNGNQQQSARPQGQAGVTAPA